MSENIIAICLYIGIMLMAGTVLVLTVVYFVKPGSNKKIEPAAAAAETVVTAAEPAAVTAVPNIKKRSFNIRSLKITAMREKPEKANIPVKKPGKPEKPEKQAVIAAATKPPEAEMKDTAALVENKKTDDKVKAATPAVETKKQENKVVVPAKEPAAAIPENNGKTPKAAAVKPEKEVVLNNPPQPVVGKSEKPEEPLSKEVPKVKVILPAPTQTSAMRMMIDKNANL